MLELVTTGALPPSFPAGGLGRGMASEQVQRSPPTNVKRNARREPELGRGAAKKARSLPRGSSGETDFTTIPRYARNSREPSLAAGRAEARRGRTEAGVVHGKPPQKANERARGPVGEEDTRRVVAVRGGRGRENRQDAKDAKRRTGDSKWGLPSRLVN